MLFRSGVGSRVVQASDEALDPFTAVGRRERHLGVLEVAVDEALGVCDVGALAACGVLHTPDVILGLVPIAALRALEMRIRCATAEDE